MNQPGLDRTLPAMGRRSHPHCFVCGAANGQGLGLEFQLARDGAVEAVFACEEVFSGYPGMLHGGVISLLLDGAMTNCLFAYGIEAVTVDLRIRFRRPVSVNCPALVRARLEPGGSLIHALEGEIVQEGRVVATAAARFVEKRAMTWFEGGDAWRDT